MLHQHRKRFAKALRGLRVVLREEASFRFQTLILALVIIFAVALSISVAEWIALTIVSAAVLVLESLNSAMERLADAVEPRLRQHVADIKDILAGAVLLMSLAAAIVGLIIFLPKIQNVFT